MSVRENVVLKHKSPKAGFSIRRLCCNGKSLHESSIVPVDTSCMLSEAAVTTQAVGPICDKLNISSHCDACADP